MKKPSAWIHTLWIAAVLFLLVAQHPAEAQQGPFHFGFKKSVGGQLPSINEEGFKDIVMKHGAIFLGDTTKKELYMTFDNGYENGYTSKVLDVLKEKQVPAIFFVTGHYVKDQPELVKRMVNEGHLVGNHSWTHPDMTQISSSQIRTELEKVREQVQALTGQQAMTYLRPPRGIFSDNVLAVSKDSGYTNVFWSVAYKDWDVNQQKGAGFAFNQVVAQLHPGAVILLHTVSKDNAAALGSIIDEARKQGYEFKSLDQMAVKTYGD
ncbi:peptidoglycan-N-acetylmuramic acid deacetylase [Paenibacillus sp. BK033]|uniref:delta-lactam-biosynthetic de-N-acetylase n=1 Tax=Paenibacillus sp. BK033 TaxID=2512133 RepID=UPI001047935E|nr:delta-lactam-biosynthetic de-N-acetylase [Paenibacillus sp. BK033]TCN01851.1 peptidoglycan-N-acetylmuramic acid deacetylase [Paenibacillus sp. BK033]